MKTPRAPFKVLNCRRPTYCTDLPPPSNPEELSSPVCRRHLHRCGTIAVRSPSLPGPVAHSELWQDCARKPTRYSSLSFRKGAGRCRRPTIPPYLGRRHRIRIGHHPRINRGVSRHRAPRWSELAEESWPERARRREPAGESCSEAQASSTKRNESFRRGIGLWAKSFRPCTRCARQSGSALPPA